MPKNWREGSEEAVIEILEQRQSWGSKAQAKEVKKITRLPECTGLKSQGNLREK